MPYLPPGSMSRILDGKPAEMCELPHGSREIEAQIGGYLGRGCRRMRPEMTARSIQSWQKRKTRFSTGDYMRGNGGATPNEDNEHEAHSSNAVVGDGLRRRSNSRLCRGGGGHGGFGGGFGHMGIVRNPSTLLGAQAPATPSFQSRIPSPLASPSQAPAINGPLGRSPYGGVM